MELKINAISLKSCNDPSELLQTKGKEALKKEISFTVSGFDYLVNYAIKLYDIQSPKGKNDIFSFIKPYLDATESEIEKIHYLEIIGHIKCR